MSISWIELTIYSLAVWRVSRIIVKEIGPLAIFAKLRAYLATKQKSIGGLFDMISCVGCVSMYIGAVTSLALAGDVLEIILYTLSSSAIACLIERLTSE